MNRTSRLLNRFTAAVLTILCTASAIAYVPSFMESNTRIVAEAYSNGDYKVNTPSGVNVRSVAGAGSRDTILGAAVNGTAFTVDQINGNWGHTDSIACTNGVKSGWICLDYCLQTSSGGSVSSEFQAANYRVNVNTSLRVRKKPTTVNSEIITSLRNGTCIYIASKTGNWGYVPEYGGYVCMEYCLFLSDEGGTGGNYVTDAIADKCSYYISPACAGGSVLDAEGWGTGNCTNIQLWEKHGGENQQFKAIALSNGYYAFYNVNSGRVLDVSWGIALNGINIQLYKYNGTAAQQWRLIDAGDGYYYLQSKLNEYYYLDVSGAGSGDGTNIQLYRGNATDAQRFCFTPAEDAGNETGNAALGITSYSSEYENCHYYTSLLNTTRTGANRITVANIALSQVHYHEGNYAGTSTSSTNQCEYNRWYYNSNSAYGGVDDSKWAWCAVFVNWCMREAGVPYDVYPAQYRYSGIYAEGVSQVKKWFSDRSRYYSASSYTPKVGDLAIFNHSHIGVVAAVSGTGHNAQVTVVEGNASQQVENNTYTNYGDMLAGYCVPNY